MLRASSQGLSLSLPVVCVHRQARLLPRDSTVVRCRIRRWIISASLHLGPDIQTTKGSAASRFSTKLSASPKSPFYDTESIGPHIGGGPDALPEHPATSYSSSRPRLPSVQRIRRSEYLNIQSRASNTSTAGDGRETALHAETSTGVAAIRGKLLHVLESTMSAPEAWDAYTTLCNMISDNCDVKDGPFIPFAHLHRLCRLLSTNRPKTHLQFLRLLSASNYIRSVGGCIHLHEWNAIIDHAGKGWRRTRLEDWENALNLYNDMINGRPPGTTLNGSVQTSEDDKIHALKPDIYTFNSLLNIAVEILQPSAVRRAMALLDEAGITPSRITYLTMLKYYGQTQHMSGVRSTILRMRDQGLVLGLDGINACMWAYGQNGRYDLVKLVYRLLRHNISPEQDVGIDDEPLALARHLEEEEYVYNLDDTTPDEATFATVIQIMAYYGDLSAALSVFADMLTLLPVRPDAGTRKTEGDKPSISFTLMNTVFRAIFLGFSRHGIPPLRDEKFLPPRLRISNPPGRLHWSLQNLQTVFDIFLSQPEEARASRSTLHWIMQAFDITSGKDEVILQEVWKKLDERFGMGWVAPTNRLAAWKRRLFPETSGDSRIQSAPSNTEHEAEEDQFML